MSNDDKRIREFAYQIWESEGKPEGQEARHWEMACKLAEAEALAPTKPPKAAGKPAATKPKAPAKVKPAGVAKVLPPGEKATEKKPRAPRKPPVA
ncbi:MULTISPECIES: DUF2934 domain-containing protein [unclassified Pseudomonas]|uniref:DUF2934 domain-containing protein n=1 Tax=unclassified Pseudomonas TaxID=196821 RepID=UPI000A1ECCE4|nr:MULTISPECIES: DUF2934 domain-containing protein [unclassified Pseudomonas]